MDPDNALRVLRGEQFIELVPERFRREMLAKRVTRLVKSADGGGSFQVITDPDEVIRLAGRGGPFDLAEEYGVPQKLVETLDITSQLAMAAGLDALREAGIPLVQTWRPTSTGKFLPDRWMIPAAMRDETGVIFASVFPGGAALAAELERYYQWEKRLDGGRRAGGLAPLCARLRCAGRDLPPHRAAARRDLRPALRVRPPVHLPHPLHGPQPVRRVHRRARAQHAGERGLRDDHAGHRAGRGLDSLGPLPPGAGHRRRRRHRRLADGMGGRRLPGPGRRRDGRPGE